MSHQGYEGWFPECLICGMGNLDGVVCITPSQEDEHGLTPITGERSGTSEVFSDGGHAWKRCLLCPTAMSSDPLSWGSVAYCISCWNHFTQRGLFPPTSAKRARSMTDEQWG
jgi:hypothetical protein